MIKISIENGMMVVTNDFISESTKEEERNNQDKSNFNQIKEEGSRNE